MSRTGKHIELPKAFVEQMNALIDSGSGDLFFNVLESESPTSIRFNSAKVVDQNSIGTVVPWCENAMYLDKRPQFTLDPLFHAGAYYVQEAASMFVLNAIKQHVDDSKSLRVLDLCAAPGGKSTLLSGLGNEHLYVFNEIIKSRYNILTENIVRWGLGNRILSNHDVSDFSALKGFFDVVLVDAPCSGEGMFRKDPRARLEWSKDNVQLCYMRQRRILSDAAELVSNGGLLVYSTCTYNRLENEDNVKWMEEHLGLHSQNLDYDDSWGVSESIDGDVKAYRFYPHLTKSEGFFISVLRRNDDGHASNYKGRKPGIEKLSRRELEVLGEQLQFNKEKVFFRQGTEDIRAVDKSHWNDVSFVSEKLKRIQVGECVGKFARKDFIPSHDLAMSIDLKSKYPVIEVDKVQALKFLKKEDVALDVDGRSWHLIQYKGLGLGWVKVLDNRINNYLPKGLRIIMPIDYNTIKD